MDANEASPTPARVADVQGVQVKELPVHGRDAFRDAFATMAREDHQAAIVVGTPLSLMYRRDVIVSAAQYRVPTVYETPSSCSNSRRLSQLFTAVPYHAFAVAASLSKTWASDG